MLLYYHFIKTIKRTGTSFQSPALNQKNVRNLCSKMHYYLVKFYFDSTQDEKEISKSVTSIMQKCL